MKIDVHAHLIPQRCIDATEQAPGSWTWRFQAGSGSYTSKTPASGFDADQISGIDRRLSEMTQQGIDLQVLSVPPFCFFYDTDADVALDLCRRFNDAFADTVAANPDRFLAMATLPLQAPEEAARELERAVRDLGLRGVEIGSNIAGRNLDDPSLAPFYAKVQELDVPVFIHPFNVLGADRLSRYYLANLIGNPGDTTVAAASLIFGGVLKEFPRLKFYLAHGGGTCPYIYGRWDHGWNARPESRLHIDRPPSEYFRLLYFDTIVHGMPALEYLVGSVGAERVLLGTDYPFDMGDYDSVETVDALTNASAADKELIQGGNAAALFKIEV